VAAKTVADGSLVQRLSDRELEVFQLIGQGHGTRQIAEELHLSVKTIESYRAHIKDKLKLKTATELARCAIQWVQSGCPS
jgi:DNA-binding NarL/FixJ family response regulator